jgi:hypothetical protein
VRGDERGPGSMRALTVGACGHMARSVSVTNRASDNTGDSAVLTIFNLVVHHAEAAGSRPFRVRRAFPVVSGQLTAACAAYGAAEGSRGRRAWEIRRQEEATGRNGSRARP